MNKIITTILSILIIIVILKDYLHKPSHVHSNVNHNEPAADKQNQAEHNIELEGNFLERGASKIIYNLLQTKEGKDFISNVITTNTEGINFQSNKTPYHKQKPYIYDIQTFGTGKGEYYAMCGSQVLVKYYIINSQEEEIDQDEKVIHLGNNDVIDLFDDIIIGMKPGQIRYAYIRNNKNDILKIQVSLLEITKYQFSDSHFIKIFDNNVNYFSNNFTCGSKVTTDVKITSLKDGQTILQPTSYKFQIGDDHYPIIFNYALQDKNISSTRSTIVQGDLLQSMNVKDSKIDMSSISATDFFLIEFFNTTLQDN